MDSNRQYMVLGAIGQILRNQGLKLWNIQAHIINFQAYQSAFFWVCLDQLVYYILKVYWWTLTCSIWWLGLLDSFGEIAFLGFRIYKLTYRLILCIFKLTKVYFFGSVQTNWYTTSEKYAGGLYYVVYGAWGYWIDYEKSMFEVVEHAGSYYQFSSIPQSIFWVCLDQLVYYI